MMHVICMVHALHNVCLTIINNTLYVKHFIHLMNSILSRNIKHISYFKQVFKQSIPTPVITRFGSFLQTSCFYFHNYSCIESFLNLVLENRPSSNNSSYYSTIQELLHYNLKNLLSELEEINNYNFLVKYINDLESNKIQLNKQIEIIEHIRILLQGDLRSRINSIISNNPDYQNLIDKIKNENLENDNLKYLTLSSVDVERSFSILRKVLKEGTFKLTHKSINNYMVIRYNKLMEYVEL